MTRVHPRLRELLREPQASTRPRVGSHTAAGGEVCRTVLLQCAQLWHGTVVSFEEFTEYFHAPFRVATNQDCGFLSLPVHFEVKLKRFEQTILENFENDYFVLNYLSETCCFSLLLKSRLSLDPDYNRRMVWDAAGYRLYWHHRRLKLTTVTKISMNRRILESASIIQNPYTMSCARSTQSACKCFVVYCFLFTAWYLQLCVFSWICMAWLMGLHTADFLIAIYLLLVVFFRQDGHIVFQDQHTLMTETVWTFRTKPTRHSGCYENRNFSSCKTHIGKLIRTLTLFTERLRVNAHLCFR